MATESTSSRIALLAGSTGLVGHALLPMLLASPRYTQVHVLLRRAVPGMAAHPKLTAHTVDFAALPSLPAIDDVFIALGTTIKIAGSQAAFRAVDFDAVVNTARAARASGATRLAVVSAMGADAKSSVFYSRVKGEMQEALAGLGYASLVIAQPSLLVGDRAALGQPVRQVEAWGARWFGWLPKSMRPIQAAQVARTMLEALARPAPGTTTLKSRDLH